MVAPFLTAFHQLNQFDVVLPACALGFDHTQIIFAQFGDVRVSTIRFTCLIPLCFETTFGFLGTHDPFSRGFRMHVSVPRKAF